MDNRSELDAQITFIYVRDLATSAAFYEGQLGLTLWRDQGSCRIYHATGSAYIGICQANDRSKGQPAENRNLIITLVTEDVEGWYTHLQAQGVTFEHPPQVNPHYNILHCFLHDPDGYLIEIQRFLTPAD